MSDYKKQFDQIQEAINDVNIKIAKYQERKKILLKEIEQQKEVFKDLGITSEEAGDVLLKLEKDIKEEIEKCQKTLN